MRKFLFTVLAMASLTGVALAQDSVPAAAPAAAPAPVAAAPVAAAPAAAPAAADMSAHDHHAAQHAPGGVGVTGAHPIYGNIHHHTGGRSVHHCVKHCGQMVHTGKMDAAHEKGCVDHCHSHHKSSPHANQNATKGSSKIGK